ncbi:MAG: class I SAM-dependent methyltransferase [Candidatus Brocadiia bacterium]
MAVRIPAGEKRTVEQLTRHYELEKQLAHKLRNSSQGERKNLYKLLYDELYRAVPELSAMELSAEAQNDIVAVQTKLLEKFLFPGAQFLEIGPGNCRLAFEVAKRVKHVYAMDVSAEITKNQRLPDNFKLVIYDGCEMPVGQKSVDIAYSNHVIEHIHPDDAVGQIKNINRVLKENGVYICLTPNRLHGPHDISGYFGDKVATGFHLKEYTYGELANLFRQGGFDKIKSYIYIKRRYIGMPLIIIKLVEWFTEILPFSLRWILAGKLPFRLLNNVIIAGRK